MIQAHLKIKASGLPNYKGCRLHIPSVLNFDYLEQELAQYHDKLVVELLKFGFPVDHDGSTGSHIVPRNHVGACKFKSQVMKQLQKEVEIGACIGPFAAPPISGACFSPLNSVPKKDSDDRRLILDLSYPEGNSINDSINKDWYQGIEQKLQLPSIDTLVSRTVKLGPGCKIFKVDFWKA